MRTIFKRLLIPPFLNRLDGFLLARYPVIWRTRAHFVLFYAALGAVLLFAAGFYAEVSAVHLQVDPIKPIEMTEDPQCRYAFTLVLPFIVFWGYKQYQAGYPFYKFFDTVLTLGIYTICFWIILGFTIPAYRMGTIYRTAWYWMDEADLNRLKNSGIYPNGFILLRADSIYTTQQDTFYQRRELIFKEVYQKEDLILQHRYDRDTVFWYKLFRACNKPRDEELQPYLRYSYDRTYQPIRSGLSFIHNVPRFTSIIYDESYRSLLSELSYRLEASYRSDLSSLSFRSYGSYRTNMSYLSYQSDQSNVLIKTELIKDTTYRSYLVAFSNIAKIKSEKVSLTIPSTYHLLTQIDTILKAPSIYLYHLHGSVEDAVRSILHARQFIQEQVFYKNLSWLPFVVALFSILFFLSSFFSLSIFVYTLTCSILSWLVLNMELTGLDRFIGNNFTTGYRINIIAFLSLSVIALIVLTITLFLKSQIRAWFETASALLFVGTLLTIFPLLGLMDDFIGHPIGLPYDPAFFGVQILGLIGAFLIPYVNALPKKT